MPLITQSTYKTPRFLSNGHVQTVVAYYRKNVELPQKRERIFTPDGDFLDIDWTLIGSNKLVILSHGLEGDSKRPYVLAMAKAMNNIGWDALAWNYRGCSEELNLKPRFYHSGETDDLHSVIIHALSQQNYESIALIGFSVGGNITLKYLGENLARLSPKIKKAITFSVPCELRSCARKMARPGNRIYMKEFLRCFRQKIREKEKRMPGEIEFTGFSRIKNFMHYDGKYTAPLNGFRDIYDYWDQSSSKQYLKSITIPTLIVNAQNDPFLTKECYPIQEAQENHNVFLEVPKGGGHLGFIPDEKEKEFYWSEHRAVEFILGK